MMGPASGGLQVFTLRRNARKGVGYSGTPWSGHAVNWNWRTSRFSLEPFWGTKRRGERRLVRDITLMGLTAYWNKGKQESNVFQKIPGPLGGAFFHSDALLFCWWLVRFCGVKVLRCKVIPVTPAATMSTRTERSAALHPSVLLWLPANSVMSIMRSCCVLPLVEVPGHYLCFHSLLTFINSKRKMLQTRPSTILGDTPTPIHQDDWVKHSVNHRLLQHH